MASISSLLSIGGIIELSLDLLPLSALLQFSCIPLFKLCERDYIASFPLKDIAQGVYVTAGRIAIFSE